MLTDFDRACGDARRRAEEMRFRHRVEAVCLALDNLRRSVDAFGAELVDALEDARVLREAPAPHPHTVAVLLLAADLYQSADAGEES